MDEEGDSCKMVGELTDDEVRPASAPPLQEVELEREMKILEEGPLGKLSDATATADKPTN